MAELSGVAKLSNGEPASQIVAVHPLRGHVRTAVPALDGSYAIPGVPKGKWLVTAEGPAGYRPLTHVLDVERVPEAESLYLKVWEAWSFDETLQGSRDSPLRAGSAGALVNGRNGLGLSVTSQYYHYESDAAVRQAHGYAMWFKRTSAFPTSGMLELPGISESPTLMSATYNRYARVQINVSSLRVSGSRNNVNNPLQSIDYRFQHDVWYFIAVAVHVSGIRVWVNDQAFDIPGNFAATDARPRKMALTQMSGQDLVVDDLMQLHDMPTNDEMQYLYQSGIGRTWAQLKSDAGFE